MKEKKEIKPVKASSIRRAITTLSKAGFIRPEQVTVMGDTCYISIQVPHELIQPKKRIRKPKI